MNEFEAWAQRLAQLKHEIPNLFTLGKTALYVGATPRRSQMVLELSGANYDITLLEAFKPNADYYAGHPWFAEVICGDVQNICEIANGRKWDLVVWWHGPEHVDKERLPQTLADLEAVANEMVVLGSPWGQNLHGMVSGNPHSVHQASIDMPDLEKLGYSTSTLGEKDNPGTWCHLLAWKGGNQQKHIDVDVTVYTAIFGAYDTLKPVEWSDTRFVCFTDQDIEIDGWNIERVARQFNDPQREARMYKILSHQWIDARYSIWQDGSGKLGISPSEIIELLGDRDIAVFAHPSRKCIYDEAQVVIATGKAVPAAVHSQIYKYLDSDYPRGNGLVATGLVVRRHTPEMVRLNNAWWSEVMRHTNRDQLSFNYVAWLLEMEYGIIPGYLWKNEIITWNKHLQ